MNEKKYSYHSFGLISAMFLGILLPKTAPIKNLINYFPFDISQLFWVFMALIMLFVLPRAHVPGRLRTKGQVCNLAFSGAVMFLALRFGAGLLMQKIAESPYDISPFGVFMNLINLLPMLIVREMVRARALGAVCRDSKNLWVRTALIVLIFCLLEINFFKVSTLKNTEEWFIYIAKDVLPLIAKNSLLTVLVINGGTAAGVAYSGSYGAFTYILPLLPSLTWISESALGIIFPSLMALFSWEWYGASRGKRKKKREENRGIFIASLVFTVAFAWFVVGVFPVYPSVILTGSMEPEIFPGDVVLIEKFLTQEEIYKLSENDIINFDRGDITINHRISAVYYDSQGNISFQTKGDNNKTVDEIVVLPGDLNGIVKRVVPKAGIPVLWLHRSSPVPEGVSDNEIYRGN